MAPPLRKKKSLQNRLTNVNVVAQGKATVVAVIVVVVVVVPTIVAKRVPQRVMLQTLPTIVAPPRMNSLSYTTKEMRLG